MREKGRVSRERATYFSKDPPISESRDADSITYCVIIHELHGYVSGFITGKRAHGNDGGGEAGSGVERIDPGFRKARVIDLGKSRHVELVQPDREAMAPALQVGFLSCPEIEEDMAAMRRRITLSLLFREVL